MSGPVADLGLIGLAVMGQNLILNTNDRIFFLPSNIKEDFVWNKPIPTTIKGHNFPPHQPSTTSFVYHPSSFNTQLQTIQITQPNTTYQDSI